MNLGKLVFTLLLCFSIFVFPASIWATDYENVVIIGGFVPVDSYEGLFTPLIYWDHNTKDYPLNGALNVTLETSTLTAKMEHEISDSNFFIGYGATGTFQSESLGTDIYDTGRRLEQNTYDGSSASSLLFVRYGFTKKWDLTYTFQNKKTWFYTNDDTGSGFILPPEYTSQVHNLKLRHKGSFFNKKGEFKAVFSQGHREDMANWTLDSDAVSKDDYYKLSFKWTIPVSLSKKNKSELILSGGDGHNIDLLNDFGVGGLASQYTAAGFYRYEFRAKKVIAANYTHEYHFSEHKRLLLYADLLYFESVDLSYLDGTDRNQTIGSLGIGFYYGIESLKGLPVIIRFGEGLNVDNDSEESHRREVMILVVAGF